MRPQVLLIGERNRGRAVPAPAAHRCQVNSYKELQSIVDCTKFLDTTHSAAIDPQQIRVWATASTTRNTILSQRDCEEVIVLGRGGNRAGDLEFVVVAGYSNRRGNGQVRERCAKH